MAVKNYLINDKWLDINKQNIVEVKSTDGVIGSIKLNGEEYGGSGGGGSEMFKIATVTIVNNSTNGWGLSGGITTNNNNSIDGYGFLVLSDNLYLISTNEGAPRQSTKTLQAILMPQNGKMGAAYTTYGTGTPAVTGNAEYFEEEEIGTVCITGDCTITIS